MVSVQLRLDHSFWLTVTAAEIRNPQRLFDSDCKGTEKRVRCSAVAAPSGLEVPRFNHPNGLAARSTAASVASISSIHRGESSWRHILVRSHGAVRFDAILGCGLSRTRR